MVWSYLFGITIAHGIFLLVLMVLKRPKKTLALWLIAGVILAAVITNADFFLITSGLYRTVPKFFGMSFGMLLLLGPLYFLYTKATTDPEFTWRWIYALHFIPYVLHLVLNIPLYVMDTPAKIAFVETLLSGHLAFRPAEVLVNAVQIVIATIYFSVAIVQISKAKVRLEAVPYVVPVGERIRWLNTLLVCFMAYVACIIILLAYLVVKGRFIPEANYLYTLACSAILYMLGFRLILNPELVNPDFLKKYQNAKQFSDEDQARHLAKLHDLIDNEKLFLDPALKLNDLAAKIGIPPHQLSKLVNERCGKSFVEFINEKRVQEFITRMDDDQYKNLSLLGIALDVGFNSKSSFNLIFKKVTGYTPSEFRENKHQP
ncbi:helix-turn-helix domain-containing protein [Chryseolinea soli]|uniref:AraC family transcriptional regulator n=1 Tax=Chryseolinea soli TaxID=2321403 RepID=A0A385SMM9_9BACT|nr:helix-turn-helix domain-containing protein [Chryseolinea soli]AYB31611.1 AraC family transcriptional regulator [Chryseolinea soli]